MSASRVVITDAFKAGICQRRGIAAMRRNSFLEALAHFDDALLFEPDDPVTHWNKATSLLSLGDYVNGFREFEWRWKMYDWRWGLLGDDIYQVRQMRPWRGESLHGKSLLFYWEMGYGDAIQQLRYVPVLKKLGATVTVLMTQPLVRLAQTFDVKVIEHVPVLAHSMFDFRCSLFGVMAAMTQSAEDIPDKPYLPLAWEPGGSLGLVWSGRTQQEFSASELLARLNLPRCIVQSMQPGPVSPCIRPLPPGDFLDTARLLATMDHVVTVDTALAHLAGAIGHPSTHVLIPYLSDWRWHRASAWYPKLHIYRQPQPGNWNEPLARIHDKLSEVMT